MITVPQFNDFTKLHAWLIANKQAMIAQKTSTIKLADAFSADFFIRTKSSEAQKAAVSADANAIEVESIINTTKLLDSHGDVHLDGLWNKSLRETKTNYLVKEHNFSFDGTISDNVKAYTKNYTWAELGFDYTGSTQALVYNSVIDKSDTTGMFEKYRMGKVRQHSVGMRYVKMALAIDNKRYPDEEKIWKLYYDQIANKADVDALGYFWAITEAKNIEGSAVMRGSNPATPTQSVQEVEPDKTTQSEPLYKALKIGAPVAVYSDYFKLKL